MDPRLQRRVQRYGWDRAAEHYEPFWKKQLQPAQDLLLEMAAIQPGERVLGTASGTGLTTFPAALATGPSGEVMATDISQVMVDRIATAAGALGFSNVSTERMGAEELQLPDASFDVAICALGFMYYPDPDQAMREMVRVLRPGGRAAVAVWGARKSCGWAEIFPIVDARVETEVCPLFFQLGTGDTLQRTAEEAGLVDVQTERISTVLEYDSVEDAAGAAFAGGPVAMAYSRFDDATKAEAHAEYIESIEPYRVEGDSYRIPGEFVVTHGIKPEP